MCPICPNCGAKKFVRLASDNEVKYNKENNIQKGQSDGCDISYYNHVDYKIDNNKNETSNEHHNLAQQSPQDSKDAMIILKCKNCNAVSRFS